MLPTVTQVRLACAVADFRAGDHFEIEELRQNLHQTRISLNSASTAHRGPSHREILRTHS